MSTIVNKARVKVKLGKRPKVFAPIDVEFDLVADGDQVGGDEALFEVGIGIIPVTFVYRTRSEFGTLVNEMHSEVGATPGLREDGTVDFEQLHKVLGSRSAVHLQKSIAAWGLDEPLSLDALKDLCDEMPGGASALMRAYAALCTEGRLGN